MDVKVFSTRSLVGVNLNAAEICMVTVDTATGANLVVWNKELNLGISEYVIYKETSSLKCIISYWALSLSIQFIVSSLIPHANSSVHSYRYKLRTIR